MEIFKSNLTKIILSTARKKKEKFWAYLVTVEVNLFKLNIALDEAHHVSVSGLAYNFTLN